MFKDNPKLKSIFLGGFLLSFNLALTAYVNSSYLASFVGEGSVGFLFTLASLATISSLLLIPKILPRLGGHKFLLWAVGASAVSLLVLSIIKNVFIIIPFFIIYFAVNNVIIFILDELLEIFSQGGILGRLRGFYLAIMSSAWVLAQLFLGKILGGFSFQVLFFVAFEVMAALFLVSFLFLKNIPDPNYDKVSIFGSVKLFFTDKKLARSYGLNFLLQFFFSWMVIYMPIYLNAHIGLTWAQIGIIFTVMLTPFVFMPVHLGKLSDKLGEKKMLMLGFALASVSTFTLFFIKVPYVWLWALALFTTRIGASTVEIMSDIYFFKHIRPESDEFIGIYRNASPAAYIIGPLVATFLLLVLPAFNFLFLILGILMIAGIYLASTIEWSDV